jgi:hypothetical protein
MRTSVRGNIAAALMACFLILSCATITRSKADDQLFVDSNPPGASVFVNGVFAGVTPGLVPMPRDRTIGVVCKLRGYQDSSTTVRREVAPAAAFDRPVFAVVDVISGAAYRLQRRTLVVELAPVPTAPL